MASDKREKRKEIAVQATKLPAENAIVTPSQVFPPGFAAGEADVPGGAAHLLDFEKGGQRIPTLLGANNRYQSGWHTQGITGAKAVLVKCEICI